jgi:hypothetical protein
MFIRTPIWGIVNMLSGLFSSRLVCHTRRMRTPSSNHYKRHRLPNALISHDIWLYHRSCLSYRDVEALWFTPRVIVTYEAIRKWCRKFGQHYANQPRRRRLRPALLRCSGFSQQINSLRTSLYRCNNCHCLYGSCLLHGMGIGEIDRRGDCWISVINNETLSWCETREFTTIANVNSKSAHYRVSRSFAKFRGLDYAAAIADLR